MRKNFGFLSLLRNLAKNEDGNVLLYFAAMVPVTMGMIGLVLEGGAFYHLNSDLQELADAAAVAGATELDGAGDAITRATDRAENLLSNDPHWSNVTSSGLQITTPAFYSSLNPDTVTTTPGQARFIKVTTVTRQVAPSFLHAVGVSANAQTSTSAVAGSSYVACNVQPLMICNPWEQTADPVFAHHVTAGMMIKLLQQGGNNFGPGDFGLLDPAGVTNSGANKIAQLLSQASPNFCFVNNISPRPGQATQKVQNGINVRFNVPPQGGNGNDPLDQTPAPNVIKGQTNSNLPACPQNRWTAHPGEALPLDCGGTCFTTVGSASVGNGTMTTSDKNTYWAAHHGAGTTWPAGVRTRYAAYLLEQGIGGTAPSWVGGSNEPHLPACTPTTPVGDSTRRVMSVAVVDCLANNVHGNSTTNLVSSTYVEFFIPRLADSNVYLEFIRFMTPQSDATKLHHVVQLVR